MSFYKDSDKIDWFDEFSEELNLSQEITKEGKDFFLNELPERMKFEDIILVAVSMYIIGRQEKEYRSKKQYANCISNKIFQRRREQELEKIKRAYKKVKNDNDLNMTSPCIESQIEFLCDKLDINGSQKKEAMKMGEKAMKSEILSGRSPVSVSAGSIMVVVEDIEEDTLTDYTGTGSGTLRRMEEFMEEKVIES